MESSIVDKLKKLEKEAAGLSPDEGGRKEIFTQYHALSERFLNGLENKNTYDCKYSDSTL